jgi:phosphate transport system protein
MSTPPLLEELVERDLREIRRQLRGMADLVVRALQDAVTALRSRDRRLAYAVILTDNRIDALEGHIDRMCQEFLVRHMPVATQLRFIIAATKVNSELERMGDYADAVARRTVSLVTAAELPAVERMCEMAVLSVEMVRAATDAFLEGDVAKANHALELEARVDDENHSIFHDLSHPETGERDLTTRFALLGILNRIERVADRACNIAEDAIYAAKGEVLRHAPRQQLRVLLLSPRDATLGPMAEAIARRRAPLRCSFASCGLAPAPLDPRMVAYMASRGIEVTRPRPRGLEDVGPLDDFYVVVLLSREAEEGCPVLPYKTVALTWDIPDPSKVEGTPQEVEAAYAKAYHEIDTKLGDLVAAMLGENPEIPERS